MSDQRPAHVISCTEVGKGCYQFTFQADDQEALDYQAGHVIAFDCVDKNGETLHHPYTITENNSDSRQCSFVFKHIPDGPMTSLLINMHAGDQVFFSGKYHKPIIEEIADEAQKFVGISTGSGIGPLYGFVKEQIAAINMPVHIYAGYRSVAEIAYQQELDALAKEHDHFSWQASISGDQDPEWQGLRGRISFSVADDLHDINDCHFHLVGNGAMINTMRSALQQAGVPKAFISKESFFNHGEKADDASVDALIKSFSTSH